MTTSEYSSIPLELMEILNRINNNVNDVKDRITRIEAQDHSVSIKALQAEIDRERDERIKIQIELANIKTKLAPMVGGVSLLGAGIIQFLFTFLHH